MKHHIEKHEDTGDNEIWGDVAILNDIGNVFNANLRYNSCCGLFELCNFDFWHSHWKADEKDAFALEFLKAIQKVGVDARKGIIHLTLTGDAWEFEEHGTYYQPQWFVDAVKTYPGAVSMDHINPNTGNMLTMFMLPTNTEA